MLLLVLFSLLYFYTVRHQVRAGLTKVAMEPSRNREKGIAVCSPKGTAGRCSPDRLCARTAERARWTAGKLGRTTGAGALASGAVEFQALECTRERRLWWLLAGSDGLREPDLMPQGQHLVREDVRQTESGEGQSGRSVARRRCRSDGPSAPASLELDLS